MFANAIGWGVTFFVASSVARAGVGQSAPTLQETLHGGGAADTATFGRTVATDDQTMVVGSRFADGIGWVAHVYQRTADGWQFFTQLISPLGVKDSSFDVAIAASTGVVFIGEPRWDVGSINDAGGVHIFEWIAGWPTYQTTLLAPSPGHNDYFGTALDAEGDVVVVGAPENEPQDHGMAFVFRRSKTGWNLESTLTAPTPSPGRFGAAVALAGDTLFIAAPWETVASDRSTVDAWQAGAVHVFRFVGGTWQWQQQLTADNPSSEAEFGNAIACDGNLVLIAAWHESTIGTTDGAAYVFHRDKDTWQSVWHFKNDAYLPGFGTAVDVQNGHLLVGAPGGGGGCVFFSPLKDDWAASATLFPPDDDFDTKFGCAVAFDGEEVVIGARAQDVPGSIDEGALYTYRHNMDDSECEPVASGVMQPSDLISGDFFGTPMACDDARVIVGVPSQDHPAAGIDGAAYIFRRFASKWIQEAKLIAPWPTAIGDAVAIQGNYAVVGATGGGQGAVFIFKKAPGGGWLLDQQLLPDGPDWSFGSSVLLTEDSRLFIGAPAEPSPDGLNGAVYVFELVNNEWLQTDHLTTSGLLPIGGGFGLSLAADGDWLAVGAPNTLHENEFAGAICLFKRTAKGWLEQQKVYSPAPHEHAHFGRDIDLAGHTLAATGVGCGVSVHTCTGDRWSDGAIVMPSLCLGSALDCSLTENMLVIGSSISGLGMDSGSVFVFFGEENEWSQRGRIDTPLAQLGGGQFATQLTHNGDWIVVSAPWAADAVLTEGVGAVFAYEIPDDCDQDCNATGVADSVDISVGMSEDCNGNGIPDECDLASRSSADCNGDGIPDECQDAVITLVSPVLTPLLAGINHSIVITSPLPPIGDVTLSFSASGDLAFSSENIGVDLNGTPLGVLWGTFVSGGDCSVVPLTATIVVPRTTWQAAVGTGDAEITMTPSAGVDSAACTDGSFISCAISYSALSRLDGDGDGTIDRCNGAEVPEDLDGDGDVDGFDLAMLLGQWTGAAIYSPCPPYKPADLDGDCKVNGFDLAILLGSWG